MRYFLITVLYIIVVRIKILLRKLNAIHGAGNDWLFA